MTHVEFLTVALSFVLGLFEVAAIVANTALFHVDVLGPMSLWVALAIAIIVVVDARRRAVQAAATVAFGLWLGAHIWIFVPGTC